MYEAAPWGERRADLRQAISTANLMACQMSAENATPEWFSETVVALCDYMPTGDDGPDYRALAKVSGSDGEPG
jgi:hypothetical protein